MKKTAVALLAVWLLAGCTDSAKKVDSVTKTSPQAKATEKTQELAAQTAKTESKSDTTLAESPVDATVDATVLLATTLEKAKSTDKRVMVHLGAPW